ncbi:FadR/GntR family transcriptional regulator [Cohnella terricola]|nr:FadR/GntR family transcriptional regulator [Cohnella terricola]
MDTGTGPLKKETLVEQAIKRMERMIETEAWPLGSRIPPEPELVQLFGVSRNSIREAVKSLIHVGVLEARQGDGTYVCSKSSLNAVLCNQFRKADDGEILEVRRCLEREIARLASKRRTNGDILEMQNWLRLTEEAYCMGDYDAYVQNDYRFHLAIASATHNRLMISLYDSIAESVQGTVGASIGRRVNQFVETMRIHKDLLGAIERQEEDRAANHVEELLSLMRRTLDS